MQALNNQDDSRCRQLIQAGQYGIVQLLANAGTDSIARSNPLIVQLQVLAAVAEAQETLKTSQVQSGKSNMHYLPFQAGLAPHAADLSSEHAVYLSCNP